jgi:CHAT domain-containing protein
MGHWSASLAAAQRARAAFTAIGEKGNIANVESVLSEDYDLLGQRSPALRFGFAAVRAAADFGELDRARTGLASLCRTELRSGRWEEARALARVERELAPIAPDPRLEPDMFVRLSAAEWHLRNRPASAESLRLARDAGLRIAGKATREKQLAEIAGAEGVFVRTKNPSRAAALLSTAIDFQRHADRPIMLPELFLQRGRCHLGLGDAPSAETDFEAGIVELERQRSRVSDAELRPGIFDSAAELFAEAIAVEIRSGAEVSTIFRSVERGRARAVLEQITTNGGSYDSPRVARVEDVQHALAPGTALVEYVSLLDRLVVFVIASDRGVMRTVPATRATLSSAAREMIAAKGADGRALYDLLIAPVRDDLDGVSRIDIVADDFLSRVPFAALMNPKTRRFLVQDYTIASSPSAGVLLTTLARLKQLPADAPTTAVVLANPRVASEVFGELPSLIGAEYEARHVAHDYPKADIFTREEATSDRFLESAVSSDVVHLACHALTNERDPAASVLVCARGAHDSGGVTSSVIAHLPFRHTRVVVLAACGTLTGREAAIEGVPSIARAFVVGGVPAVIGTLWDVNDDEAAAVVRPLHRELARGVAPAIALRTAQLASIQRRLPPSQWAVFALSGSAEAAPPQAGPFESRAPSLTPASRQPLRHRERFPPARPARRAARMTRACAAARARESRSTGTRPGR